MYAEADFFLARQARPPLVAHIIYRLDVGGLENGLVNLINHLPEDRFRHAIICLADYSNFRRRIRRRDVALFALYKPPGKSLGVHFELWRLLCELRPDIVHTRNLAALEGVVPAALAGVPLRIHSEHGRDMGDLDGSSPKHRLLRRLFRPFVHHYIALSADLEGYLRRGVGIPAGRVSHIYNGVDVQRFRPAEGREPLPHPDFRDPELFIVGTVGRMQPVKDQLTLTRAFIQLVRAVPEARRRLRLVIAGDGALRAQALDSLEQAGLAGLAWLPGARDDVPRLMRGLDLFVLPSLAEGISNTILEAMASGLPVVATRVGGNPELVDEGRTGRLVPPSDPAAMAEAIGAYFADPATARAHGREARRIAEGRFSLEAMVRGYGEVYERLLERCSRR
jgi:sugar transferase (PEP-CTERM/EpsH1 system associated)